MKRALFVMGLTFAATLAIVFGVRASADALAVVLGVVLGVLASVPTTLLVTYLLTRPRPPDHQGYSSAPVMQQPPVVVINTQDRPHTVSGSAAMPGLSPPYQGRQWTVIGDLETDERE